MCAFSKCIFLGIIGIGNYEEAVRCQKERLKIAEMLENKVTNLSLFYSECNYTIQVPTCFLLIYFIFLD